MSLADKPLISTAALTLFIAAFFMVAGIFRVVAALAIRFPQWGWTLLNGGVTFLLGALIYRHFPESAIWVIGTLVGVDMLFNGVTWVMLALELRNLCQSEERAAAE